MVNDGVLMATFAGGLGRVRRPRTVLAPMSARFMVFARRSWHRSNSAAMSPSGMSSGLPLPLPPDDFVLDAPPLAPIADDAGARVPVPSAPDP